MSVYDDMWEFILYKRLLVVVFFPTTMSATQQADHLIYYCSYCIPSEFTQLNETRYSTRGARVAFGNP